MPVDEATRVRKSASKAADRDVLAILVADPAVTVRATLALNPVAPPEVDAALACDRDERVRALLGRKLAALVPTLNDEAQAVLRQHTLTILKQLVADEAERVRATIADVLKSMPEAPRNLILALAHDPKIMVCEPVIRFSPVLTSEDLIALIVAAPTPDTITAVARRPALDARVSEAIVQAAHSDAIAALLENPAAQIIEATLDALVARAAREVAWQEPLVRRPALPLAAARLLAETVAVHLLEVLSARSDLPVALEAQVRDRLRRERPAVENAERPAKPESEIEAAWKRACRLRDTGQLTEQTFIDVARRGDAGLLGAMLALKASVAAEVVERAVALRSPKGLIALAWRAGLSMRSAQALQIVLGRLPPDQIIAARPGAVFPMSQQEMRWQLEFMFRTGR